MVRRTEMTSCLVASFLWDFSLLSSLVESSEGLSKVTDEVNVEQGATILFDHGDVVLEHHGHF